MEYLKLLGVLVVIVGFALKLDNILIIVLAAVVTAIVGGLGFIPTIELVGSAFVSNRSMLIFVAILLVTGTLERNGLREAAAYIIRKVKGATPGVIIAVYGVMRGLLGTFNVGLGSHAGFIRPVIMPMNEGAVEAISGEPPCEEYNEDLKGMSSAIENITWFFAQVLFVGGSGGILVQSTLASLGYDVELIDLASVEIPIFIIALVISCVYFIVLDNHLRKKYNVKKKEDAKAKGGK